MYPHFPAAALRTAHILMELTFIHAPSISGAGAAAKTRIHPQHKSRPDSSAQLPSKNLSSSALYARCSAIVNLAAASAPVKESEREFRKHELLIAVQETQRGFATTADQRSSIEEALVSVEELAAGSPLDLVALNGTWRLNYTSAADVLVLFEAAARLPFFEVGQIFQKFECLDRSDGGLVRNVVRWSIPSLLEEQEGATLLVTAKFSIVSKRNIYLQFEEVAVENIKISEQLQSLIAPAILPRSFVSLQILQFLRTFRAQVPVNGPDRRTPRGLYYLSYLDRDMLLGRAVGSGGVFVFTRAQPL
ncbi:putative plastid-lipid-associated protein 10, chloroplastic [Apostasia shenzhenica]|uniref:Putative plastid-lipid-associated protein 10, chloroplastic n=1 Tax=Apostasia shenzhenica TaxID=1088818 RepID=A0A2I0B8Q7_9ASPA|nr:putative plastid-lipid-associated protein 10, chloroplastic [Apostasia shenzhenica]